MRIAVLGTGIVGRAVGGALAAAGHEVVVGTRDVAATQARGETEGLTLATFADAAAFGEVIVNASSGEVTFAVLEAAGAGSLSGKVLIDISNPLDFSKGFPPTLSISNTDSVGERIQAAYPDANVVKTLNTMNASLMVDPRSLAGGDHSVFVCGNDADAKATVAGLLSDLGHTDVIDLGDITSARGTEMYLPLWLRLMGALGTANFNIKVVR